MQEYVFITIIHTPSISFPNINALNKLPKDKFIYSSTHNITYNDNKFQKGKYHLHHHV